MSLFTNIVDFFNGSNKTHDQLNSFVNEKFTFFLNNSNLLLTFVSDFEDYKSGNPNILIGKSKCNECEDLYILTSDIFEKYFNKINIPYNIDVSEGTSKTNYKNKVLYFFDLKDLKKILDEQNLEKSSSDIAQLNKKRLLCKIISLSFIKLYIIVKSIYQTFNIYDSLITEEKSEETTEEKSDEYEVPRYDPQPSIGTVATPDPPETDSPETDSPETDPYGIPDPTPETDPFTRPDPTPETDPFTRPDPTPETNASDPYGIVEPFTRPDPPLIEQNKNFVNPETQTGGNMFSNMYNKLLGKKTESPILTTNSIDTGLTPESTLSPSPETNPDPNLSDKNKKLQTSNNIFYSIFVILFEDSKDEQLDATNFNVSFLTKGVSKMTNETLSHKIPKIIQHISSSKIFSQDFLGESCLLFRDDNFKFLKLETSDTESKEATMFVDEVDKQYDSFNKIIETKRKLLGTILNKENKETLLEYSNSQPQLPFANYKFFNAFKGHLTTMIRNYFNARGNLYNNIVKELFMFDKKTGNIISLNSNLTYKYISELSKKTEIYLLDLHIGLFTTLNNILTDSVNEINVMKKNAPLTAPVTTQNEPNIREQQYLGGAKTTKHNKRNNKRSVKRNIKRSIKKNRKKRQTRKAKNTKK